MLKAAVITKYNLLCRIWLDGLRKTARRLSQYCISPDRNVNAARHGYEAEVLSTGPRRSASSSDKEPQ
jgi:hypothetical protein